MSRALARRAAIPCIAVLVLANAVLWSRLPKPASEKPVFASQPIVDGSARTAHGTTSKSGAASTPDAPTPSASGSPAAPLALPEVRGRPLDVSIVGDLLASGRYASSPDLRYRALVLAALTARSATTPVEAVKTGVSALSTAVTLSAGLDCVGLELGTDDMSRTDVAGFAASYSDLMTSVRTSSPDAALVCAGTWSALGAEFDAVIEQACTQAGGRFVSLRAQYAVEANRGPAGQQGYYGLSDDIAPNDAGHRAIAEALLHAVGLA